MQLSATYEIVMVSGAPPVLAKKLRYFRDGNFTKRVRDTVRAVFWCNTAGSFDQDIRQNGDNDDLKHQSGERWIGIAIIGLQQLNQMSSEAMRLFSQDIELIALLTRGRWL